MKQPEQDEFKPDIDEDVLSEFKRRLFAAEPARRRRGRRTRRKERDLAKIVTNLGKKGCDERILLWLALVAGSDYSLQHYWEQEPVRDLRFGPRRFGMTEKEYLTFPHTLRRIAKDLDTLLINPLLLPSVYLSRSPAEREQAKGAAADACAASPVSPEPLDTPSNELVRRRAVGPHLVIDEIVGVTHKELAERFEELPSTLRLFADYLKVQRERTIRGIGKNFKRAAEAEARLLRYVHKCTGSYSYEDAGAVLEAAVDLYPEPCEVAFDYVALRKRFRRWMRV